MHSPQQMLETAGTGTVGNFPRTQLLACVARLRAVAMVLAGNRERADDLAEETVILVLTDPETRPSESKLLTRMFTTLHNLHYGELRGKRAPLPAGGDAVADTLPKLSSEEASLMFGDFRQAFWRLSDNERELLILEEAGGLSRDEVAKVCGCAPDLIEARASHARQQLLRTLQEDEFGTGAAHPT
jgi:RNA polymerase sigma-70 factor (ECF subfamily)